MKTKKNDRVKYETIIAEISNSIDVPQATVHKVLDSFRECIDDATLMDGKMVVIPKLGTFYPRRTNERKVVIAGQEKHVSKRTTLRFRPASKMKVITYL